jgi:MoaA/NifB/PqqE/SkfB family radical SAM enzyme
MSDLRQVTINASARCNFGCIYCGAYSAQATPDVSDMPALLARLRGEGYGVVVFSGGEPTLQPDLTSWIAAARDLGFQQRTLVTNASRLAQPGYVDALIEAGLTHVNVSFHSARAAAFDEISGVARAYERAREGLEALIEVNRRRGHPVHVHATVVLMRQTIPEAGETVRALAELGVPMITLEVLRMKGAAAQHEAALAFEVDAAVQALNEALAAARACGVALNTVDFPGCFVSDPGNVDLEGYLVRREKASHWVVTADAEGRLNRETHVQGPGCARCAFQSWCSGLERTLLDPLESTDGPTTLRGGAPLPAPVDAGALLRHAHAALTASPPAAPDLDYAARLLALRAPPEGEHRPAWRALWTAYGRALLARPADDRAARAALLGLYPPPRLAADPIDPRARVRALARREALLERQIAALASADPDTPAARQLRARLTTLIVARLGPFACLLFAGQANEDGGVTVETELVALTDPALPGAARERLLDAVARLVAPHLTPGTRLREEHDALVVSRGGEELRLHKTIRWTRALIHPAGDALLQGVFDP